MSSPSASPPNAEQVRRDALICATALAALALYIAVRQLAAHPVLATLTATALGLLATGGLLARARVKDRLAARSDPPARGGVIIGARRGDWLGARPRPYTLGWDSFRQHVLITGPTGRGKSFGFIDPILRAHTHRPATGVLYIDGKGDRIDQGPDPVRFDHVFCPEDPEASARWNPLAGPDPIAAARSFADALFPAAGLPNAVYYEVRGAFAIRAVAPAIALTSPPTPADATVCDADVTAALIAHGITPQDAKHLVETQGAKPCADQLRWLPSRDEQDAAALMRHITRRAQPRREVTEAEADRAAQPGTATVAALHHVLFTDGELAALADTLDALNDPKATAATEPDATGEADADADPTAYLDADPVAPGPVASDLERERIRLLAAQVRSLATLPARERAAVLSNLENRLAVFLAPPFDQLCADSDFALGDVCGGASVAMLLPTGTFPGLAEPLGRIALAQFQQAVLASQPDLTKIAVLDEFHNFVSPAFTRFLSQARSRGGAAVMSTQTIADFDIEYRDRLLANASTQIITPGALPFDAEHWSRAFGEHEVEQHSTTTAPRSILDPAPMPSVRTDLREQPRYTPAVVTELGPGQALVRQVRGRTAYPAVIVDVERDGR